MTDPKLGAAELAKFLSGFSGQIESMVKNAFTEAYRLGYSHGDRDAIARVLRAAQPNAGQTANTITVADLPGTATHKLIKLVLQASGKATPVEIERSPANTGKITREAINKALKRGADNGTYVNDGKGAYSLK